MNSFSATVERSDELAVDVDADETAALIRRAPTDSDRRITFDPGRRPGVSALLTTAALCLGMDEPSLADRIGDGGASALERLATDAVNERFAAHRSRRGELAVAPDYVSGIVREGNRRACEIAERTLDEVRQAMGTVY